MQRHNFSVAILPLLIVVLICNSCYRHYDNTRQVEVHYSEEQRDSLTFAKKHHYTLNYNFVVKADSIVLLRQQPEEMLNHMPVSAVTIHKHDRIVVMDIRTIGSDKTDSIWVEIACDQSTFGWIHESDLLKRVVPDDPISQFISYFSDTHLLWFLGFISIIAIGYTLHYIFKRNARVVHFNDIDSFYPTLLAITVASSATFYSSIQLFAPDTWVHFYFHPTLNPFAEPFILAVFLSSVWAIIIIAIAAIDDILQKMPLGEAILYLCGLAGICAANYIVFSITTMYYVGYILLGGYIYFALKTHIAHNKYIYHCGNCGAGLTSLGICPKCGTFNK